MSKLAASSFCTVDECDAPHYARGLCNKHYIRATRTGRLDRKTPEERFWGHVEKSDGCWLWTGSTTSWGYGHVNWKGAYRGAHQVAWELTNGSPAPAGFDLDHLCRTPACVRPDHLEPVSHKENVNRGARHQRVVPFQFARP